MKRREFLYLTLTAISSLFFTSNIAFEDLASASSKHLIPSPEIKETNLKFVLPLENRTETDILIIHHIGEINRDVSAAEIHQWHLANGWAGIGYHYVIRKDGSIERGRPRDTIGAHCYGHNKNSIGINVVGNFEIAEPTAAQAASLKNLCACLSQIYQLDIPTKTIWGHKDFNDTLCPGSNLYAALPTLRKQVSSELD